MQKFHKTHDEFGKLSADRTVAEAEEGVPVLFTASPLRPGESLTVRVLDTGGDNGYLWVGVTCQTPREWSEGGREDPTDMRDTWILATLDGSRRKHGAEVRDSKSWQGAFSSRHFLSVGDAVTLTLCTDASVKVAINGREVPRVFTGLPDKPLYGVIQMFLKKLEIVQTGHEKGQPKISKSMQKFHEIHNEWTKLSPDRRVAQTVWGQVFTGTTLTPGETFSVRVEEGEVDPNLCLGVTLQSPDTWRDKGELKPYSMADTWSIDTQSGYIHENQQGRGLCGSWGEEFGGEHFLTTGDVVSLTLHESSVAVAINGRSVTVFTGLPDKPLYGVIWMGVEKIEIVQTGKIETQKKTCPRNLTFQILQAGDAELNSDKTEAEPGNRSQIVFSALPVKVNVPYTVKILDQGPDSSPNIVLGLVTTIDLKQYIPWHHSATWCMFTQAGDVYVRGEFSAPCPWWRQTHPGGRLKLKDGDLLSLTLKPDRSASVQYNHLIFDEAFTDLPDTNLWFLVQMMNVKKVKLIQPEDIPPAEGPVSVDVSGDDDVSIEGDDVEANYGSSSDDLESDLVDHVGQLNVAARTITRKKIELKSEKIEWKKFRSETNAARTKVKSSRPEFFQKLTEKAMTGKLKVYPMFKAKKGKACIISLPKFEVDWLSELDGYRKDEENLCQLWDQMGFDVFIPKVQGRCLTAEEIEAAVKQFAGMLDKEDQMAVLCILSHGKEGILYGADGGKVQVTALADNLNNRNCKPMADKPKLVIVQACQGRDSDEGVRVETTRYAAAAAAVEESHLPAVSDMVICYPSMPGYISFVHMEEGSIFVKIFVEVFSGGCYKKEFSTLMLEVNDQVSEQAIKYQKNEEMTEQKQMANYHSCLRKNLFFLPCTGGKNGKDWM